MLGALDSVRSLQVTYSLHKSSFECLGDGDREDANNKNEDIWQEQVTLPYISPIFDVSNRRIINKN